MCNLHQDYDVAVVDEIQMIGDPERGHAWTRYVPSFPPSLPPSLPSAFLRLRAKGDPPLPPSPPSLPPSSTASTHLPSLLPSLPPPLSSALLGLRAKKIHLCLPPFLRQLTSPPSPPPSLPPSLVPSWVYVPRRSISAEAPRPWMSSPASAKPQGTSSRYVLSPSLPPSLSPLLTPSFRFFTSPSLPLSLHPSLQQFRKYERMTELKVADEPLLDYSQV